MATNPAGNYADDFLEQILSIPSYSGSEATLAGTDSTTSRHLSSGVLGGCGFPGTVFPLGLSLDSGFSRPERSGRFGEDFDDRAASAKGVCNISHQSFLFLWIWNSYCCMHLVIS